MIRTSRPTLSNRVVSVTPQEWGGFLLAERAPRVLQAKLTGRLSNLTVEHLQERVMGSSRGDLPTFLLLDATHLEHVPVSVLAALREREATWRRRGVVSLWIGLSPYLANLLVLAWWGEDMPPVFDDLSTAWRAIGAVEGLPSGTARGRLLAWGDIGH